MNIARLAAAATIAVAGILASISGAFAYEATATTALNVRSGPGTNFQVVGTLAPNQVVNVVECNSANTWCRVQDRTITGWASARYLRAIGTTPPRPTPPAPAPTQPDIGFSINTPSFSFSIGSGAQAPGAGRVCFFEEANYRGRSFCAAPGDRDRRLSNFWNDRIRSATIEGNVNATVCTGTGFTGRCAVVDRSVRNLGMLANDISSYYVDRRR